MFLVILLYMLFASTFTFGKAALTYMQPIMFIGMRMTAAGLLIAGEVTNRSLREWNS